MILFDSLNDEIIQRSRCRTLLLLTNGRVKALVEGCQPGPQLVRAEPDRTVTGQARHWLETAEEVGVDVPPPGAAVSDAAGVPGAEHDRLGAQLAARTAVDTVERFQGPGLKGVARPYRREGGGC